MPLLFSYGTLQDTDVQLTTLGRRLRGQPDELIGFVATLYKNEDEPFATPGLGTQHRIVRFNGRHDSRVPGVVFEVSEAELARADAYEPAGYKRISTTLASGKTAWLYAAA